jgi:hypothetical protein
MQLKGYNTKNKYMGLQQSKIDTKNYGKSPCLMGKSPISMAIFNSKLLVHQAGKFSINHRGPMRPMRPENGGFRLPGLKNWDEATDGMGCTILHYFPENPM